MTNASCLDPRFDGTAALKARQRASLVLIEGGRARTDAAADSAASTGLSPRQSLALVVFGVLFVGALCVTSLLSDHLFAARGAQALSGLPEQEVVVADGASLWSIAESLDVEGIPTADVVTWISERNDLSDALLTVGQRLVVPGSPSAA